jgi:hypothetical protein
MVVRPQLSSPNPNFSKPRIWATISDFWSRLTHELLGRLKFTIPNLQIYLPKIGEFWEVGVGDWQSMKDSFFFWVYGWTSAWRGLITGIFGILESSTTQWYQDVAPTQEFFFFFIVQIQSIVYAFGHDAQLMVNVCVFKNLLGLGRKFNCLFVI